MDITEEHVTDYMLKRMKERNRKLPINTLVQTYNGEDQMILTDLLIFYMDLGLEVSNVTEFVQYFPAKILKHMQLIAK